MRTALVTGATGFVGTNLVQQLVADGWDVTVLHRESSDLSRLRDLPLHYAVGAIYDESSMMKAMPEGLDAVFHVAGNTSMWRQNNATQTRDNVDGTRTMARAALRKKARRFIQTSSVAAYGHHHERINEKTPSNALASPVNYYRTKRLAEMEVDAAIEDGLDAGMIEPGHIVGPFDDANWSRMITLVETGKLPAIPPGSGSFCHVREVARAHITAVDRAPKGSRYLLGGADASFLEFVRIISEVTGKKVKAPAMPPWVVRSIGSAKQLWSHVTGREPDITPEGARIVSESTLIDCSKAMRELDYKAVPLREMVSDCYEWMHRS